VATYLWKKTYLCEVGIVPLSFNDDVRERHAFVVVVRSSTSVSEGWDTEYLQ
jgi:hypothetical protein